MYPAMLEGSLTHLTSSHLKRQINVTSTSSFQFSVFTKSEDMNAQSV